MMCCARALTRRAFCRYGVPKPNPETEIVFACKAGIRAMNAAKNINAMGWKRTIVYSGSFQDWFGRTY